MRPRFIQAILALLTAIYLVIGVGFLVDLDGWAAAIEVAPTTGTARTDLRATYGGFMLGIGVLFAGSLRANPRGGLWLGAVTSLGLLGGRVLSLALGDRPGPLMYQFLAAEIALAVACLALLREAPAPPQA
ncbi:MAG: DUF4345 family protein [Deltaproteobacteria bacterium]|nr:DUF4345 family protein [Deltaproteobacteria bacterium]